ncbi:hypothetical protein BACSTE_03054 [Bacteroides stercoris ATCC 43183]|jgi:hypothetical protein|uniref:Uncharacterized protein n=1 Tax=Bacteroides stercoris ATCC 43183 TaxID=449673 RepID=B0NU69_BACSE|nr:hypothetical protein BACSTE_03054 [Bacteroides stercoris ATCC 43183]EKA81564.1 hypothetical protein HMPREF1205_03522 [Bacteroides fragilis HMW 616]SDX63307.1 hypothetical protein SAMN05444283_1532 [Bacteroides stercoris]
MVDCNEYMQKKFVIRSKSCVKFCFFYSIAMRQKVSYELH